MKSTDMESADDRPMLSGNRPMAIRTITVNTVTRMSASSDAGDDHA
jgi:hypothetical protein